MDMTDRAFTSKRQQVAAATTGALICLVIVVAMFSGPTVRTSPLSFSPGDAALHTGAEHGPLLSAENVLGLLVIGLVSGIFGSMFGMGGGVLKMSFLLLFFGFHPGVSRFAALLAYFVVAVGASYRYLKLGFVMMDVVKILIPSGIVGIIFGAIIGHHLPRDVMTLLLGVFLLFIAVVMVRRIRSRFQDVVPQPGRCAPERDHTVNSPCGCPATPPATWKLVLCGFPGGFLSAMLGISGGVASNPLQQLLAHIPIKSAIANTLVMAAVTVPVACLMIMVMGVQAGHFDFWTPVLVALCLIPGSIIGSQIGPVLTRSMSSGTMHGLFAVVALVMGISMLFFSN